MENYRGDLPNDETAAGALVLAMYPADPDEKQRRRDGTHAPSGRELTTVIADEAQAAACYD